MFDVDGQRGWRVLCIEPYLMIVSGKSIFKYFSITSTVCCPNSWSNSIFHLEKDRSYQIFYFCQALVFVFVFHDRT